jgi:Zn-dependent protease with chaperone function
MVTASLALSGRWFNGHDGHRQAVQVCTRSDRLVMCVDDGFQRDYALDSLRCGDFFDGVPGAIELPDGGSLWLDGSAEQLRALVRQRSQGWAMGLATRAWAVVLCTVVLVALVAWIDRQAIGWAADQVLRIVPASVDRRLGQALLRGADQSWLKRSQLSSPRRTAILESFERAADRGAPGVAGDLVFRRTSSASEGGFNAFALPDGTVVLLDGMANALSDDELLMVLGHEIGHVVHRDGMHQIARSLGLLAMAATVWGDFSTWAATLGAGVPMQAHSRDAEREADAFMREFARRAGIPPAAEVSLWRKLQDLERMHDTDAIPGWASTHPATQERLRAAEQAAAGTAGVPATPAATR